MKKKLMAVLMVAVLVLGTSTTAFADIESPVVDNNKPEINSPVVDNNKPAEPKEQLATPTVEISKAGVLTLTGVENADTAWAEEKDITVETKSEVESVDASKVAIVGAALNANGIDEKDVVLTITEPGQKVEVEKKYENAVALNIELFVAGESKEDLEVPVAITMPIPEGVDTKNLVVLHYHGDAEEPVVIVPTVNEDGTMIFVVGGFVLKKFLRALKLMVMYHLTCLLSTN
ncbi:MAG: hypothetical protein IJA07_08180 [Agathobacter sp.]|nr:hypothetical protein [Agathobacter sp.]